ncbi:hypothetical protein POM88_018131 [Heracleum sosnowskyi]|uniref:FAS1 domain-containing protein n=1 Tax=Heracleum sosnowskyi TaxID=360622 RepID=A0AAD8IRZ1_9APIA|nr:hypothetical protein POM88_018131 [Heracleum sosnowskyi]
MAFRMLAALTLLILILSLIAIHHHLPSPTSLSTSPPTSEIPLPIAPPISSVPPISTPIEYERTLTPSECDRVSPITNLITPDYIRSPAFISAESSALSPFSYQHELSRMISAILNRKDFTIWCTFITEIFDPTTLPRNATFFVPVNSAVLDLRGKYELASFYIPRHTIPRRLPFSDLLMLTTGSTLPTLMPSKELVVTSDSRDSPYNYTINGVLVTHRNIYLSSVFAVHGIRNIFDF